MMEASGTLNPAGLSEAASKVQIEGRVSSGRKEAGYFVKLVEEQIERTLGFKPYLGTLNVEVRGGEGEGALKLLRDLSEDGVKVASPHSGCYGTFFYATVNDEVEAAVGLPHVERYYHDIIELISPVELRRELRLRDGDAVKVEVKLPTRRVKAALIDMDNTLLDTFKLYYFSLNKALAELGLCEVREEVLRSKLDQGLSLSEILRDVVPRGVRQTSIEGIASRVREIYLSHEDECVKPMDGALEALEKLRSAGVVVALTTSSVMPKEEIWRRLMKFGLDKYIVYVVSGRDVRERKPSPEMVFKCMGALKLYPKECLVVGDSIADVKAGKAAGALTAAVLTGIGDEEGLLREGPDLIAKDLLELVDSLMQLKLISLGAAA